MKEKFTRFDAAEYLKTDEDIAAYLDASLQEAEEADDVTILTRALGTVARARGMTELARSTGLTREGLYRALSENGNPELSTVMKVMRALGVRLYAESRYENGIQHNNPSAI